MSDLKLVPVNFSCQRCGQPLRLEAGFSALSEHTLAELSLAVGSSVKFPTGPSGEAAATCNLISPAVRLSEGNNGNNGFTFVGNTGEVEIVSHQLKVQIELMDLMSNTSEIDHPLCGDCCDVLVDLLEGELRESEVELQEYKALLTRLQSEHSVGKDKSIVQLQTDLEKMKLEEEALKKELKLLQEEEESLRKDIRNQEEEKHRLEIEEERYFREYAKYKQEAMVLEDECRSVDNQLRFTQMQLDKLRKTNVFNATFHLWHNGHFGTINGFRLGRLPTVPVEWWEINAAWGQTALLLSSLARKVSLTFKRYKLCPYGNYSYIQTLEDQKILPLYAYGGFRFFWDSNFDAAMVAFLDCLQQFKDEVEKSGFRLPYKMEKGKIQDGSQNSYSVKMQFNSEEQWTKALKLMLTNLKWGLTWVSSQMDNVGSPHKD